MKQIRESSLFLPIRLNQERPSFDEMVEIQPDFQLFNQNRTETRIVFVYKSIWYFLKNCDIIVAELF